MSIGPASFRPATRAWLEARFEAPTPVQRLGWPVLCARRHALLIAPTGSGKTLAAFLEAIDRLGQLPTDSAPGVRVLYVSPLKALVYDIERNLRLPLEPHRDAQRLHHCQHECEIARVLGDLAATELTLLRDLLESRRHDRHQLEDDRRTDVRHHA